MNKSIYDKMLAIDRFVTKTRHDISNMLNGIIGFAEVISLKSEEHNDIAQHCTRIVSSCGEVSKLLSEVFKVPVSVSNSSMVLDIHMEIENVVTLLSFSLQDTIAIDTELDAGHCVLGRIDFNLKSILLSLGTNSGEAMPDGGLLKIRTSNIFYDEKYCMETPFDLTPGEYIRIEISDTGVGAEAEEADRFFEPYYTTTGDRERGLGLTKAFYIVNKVRGEIDLSTSPGQGTTVTINLPL